MYLIKDNPIYEGKNDSNENKFDAIKTFVIRNLLAFKAENNLNKNLFYNLINKICEIGEEEDEKNEEIYINKIKKALRKTEWNLPEKNVRLETLLYTLRKNIENLSLYRKMGISPIFPEKNTKCSFDFPGDSIESRNDLINFLDSDPNQNWINELAIVYVYGNIKWNGNKYGHALIYLGRDIGYLHVNGPYEKPEFMSCKRFDEYLNENKSFVIDVHPFFEEGEKLTMEKREKIIDVIAGSSNEPWLWKMIHHNCLTFAQYVAMECGVSPEKIGYVPNQAKRPIETCMAVDRGISPEPKEVNLLRNVSDDAQIIKGVAGQLFKNIFDRSHSRVDLSLNDGPPPPSLK